MYIAMACGGGWGGCSTGGSMEACPSEKTTKPSSLANHSELLCDLFPETFYFYCLKGIQSLLVGGRCGVRMCRVVPWGMDVSNVKKTPVVFFNLL